jgi:uncharacterized membrane protein
MGQFALPPLRAMLAEHMHMKRLGVLVALIALLIGPAVAVAGPRSGGSFGGRSGFRFGGGTRSYSPAPQGYRGGGGSHFVFLPGLGWGWGGYGLGGGMGGLGTLMLLGVVGFGAVMVVRALRQARTGASRRWAYETDDDDGDNVSAYPDRAYVYKVQLGLGRSARGIQDRLARFAAEGDTSSAGGLAQLLQQTALELLRESDAVRYGSLEASGPMSLTNGETRMTAAALAERARFSVERVRGADGAVRRSDTAVAESAEVLEFVVVTVIVAARQRVVPLEKLADQEELKQLLGALGGVPPDALLGLEVIWTPADPQDSLTDTDLLTTYPELRSL